MPGQALPNLPQLRVEQRGYQIDWFFCGFTASGEPILGRVFHDAKPALQAYTLRKRREIFDWINGLTAALIPVSAVLTQRQVEAARRRAVETWLQRNGMITITKNQRVLPAFPEKTPRN
jgi:predicted solute-binding protein